MKPKTKTCVQGVLLFFVTRKQKRNRHVDKSDNDDDNNHEQGSLSQALRTSTIAKDICLFRYRRLTVTLSEHLRNGVLEDFNHLALRN